MSHVEILTHLKRQRDVNWHYLYMSATHTVSVNGIPVSCVTLNEFAKSLGLTYPSVWRWHKYGVMPTPFFMEEYGGKSVPAWSKAQAINMAVVIDAFYEVGYVTIQWDKKDKARKLMHAAGEAGAIQTNAMIERKLRARENKMYVNDLPKFGVVFDD